MDTTQQNAEQRTTLSRALPMCWMLVAAALAGCSPGPARNAEAAAEPLPRSPATRTAPAPLLIRITPAPTLIGSLWTLSRLQGQPLLPGTHINLGFNDESMYGYDGCNWYGVRYKAPSSGDPASYAPVGVAESTQIGCDDAVLLQGKHYFEAMRTAVALREHGEVLAAVDAGGAAVLEFARQPRVAMDPARLRGSGWQLMAMDDDSRAHAAEHAVTLRFGQATLRGHGGCRDYTGTWQAEKDELRIPSLAMAATTCADASASSWEGRFTTLLSQTHRYTIDQNGRLLLHTSTGHTLLFAPCEGCAQ